MNIMDVAVLILVISLFSMRYLLKVDPRFPIIVSIAFLVASALFYFWDPNPWAILAFYSFVTGILIVIIERFRPSSNSQTGPEGEAEPFFGRLDRIRNLRKQKNGSRTAK